MARLRMILGRCRDQARAVGMAMFPERVADRFLVRPIQLDPRRRETILIAPPSASNAKFSGGNIGDQAMIESFLDNVGGPIRIITSGRDPAPLPARFAGRVTIDHLPKLIYGWGLGNVMAFRTLRRRLPGASHLALIGADVMDGGYDWHSSERRARVVAVAAALGVDSRVLGFSWNAHPHPRAVAALTRAGAAGAALLLRDPVSFGRAAEDHLPGIAAVADMVFSAREIDTEPLHRYLGAAPPPYALVNVSGLVGAAIDQSAEYDAVISALLDRGLRVVLLPHVSRQEADDIEACRQVWQRHRTREVLLIDSLLHPAGVLGFCSAAAIVVTGRMHLSIMALNSGVPAIALATQGKVEGLFDLFGAAENCVDPVPGFGERLAAAADRALADPNAAQRIGSALPAVRRSAERNFEGLPSAAAQPVAP